MTDQNSQSTNCRIYNTRGISSRDPSLILPCEVIWFECGRALAIYEESPAAPYDSLTELLREHGIGWYEFTGCSHKRSYVSSQTQEDMLWEARDYYCATPLLWEAALGENIEMGA